MKEVSTRQMALIIFIATCAMKLLILPSLIISSANNSVWLVYLIMFLLDGAILSMFLAIMKHYPDLTMQKIMENTFGKIFTKIFYFLLALIFCLKVSVLIRDCYEFYTETSYVDLNWIVFLLPTILLISYVSSKRFRSLGRASEIFIYFIGITLIMGLIFALPSGDYLSFLPILKNGFQQVTSSCFDYSLWFGDFLIMFLFLGNIKVEQKSFKKVLIYYIIACAIVFIISYLHFAIYGSISSMFKTSIVDVTEYVPRLSTTGRFTWIIIFLWPIASVYTMCLFTSCAVKSFEYTFSFSKKEGEYASYVSIAIAIAILIAVGFSQVNLVFVITNYLKYFVVIVQYVIPLFLGVIILLLYKQKDKNNYLTKGGKRYVKKPLEE